MMRDQGPSVSYGGRPGRTIVVVGWLAFLDAPLAAAVGNVAAAAVWLLALSVWAALAGAAAARGGASSYEQ